MSAAGSRRVLVVEDDPGIATLIRVVLERQGYGVTIVGNGREALDAVADGYPLYDALLLDLCLPLISGQEVLRALGRSDSLMLARTVVITSLPDKKLGIPEGVSPFRILMKPFDLDELTRSVDECSRGDH